MGHDRLTPVYHIRDDRRNDRCSQTRPQLANSLRVLPSIQSLCPYTRAIFARTRGPTTTKPTNTRDVPNTSNDVLFYGRR